MNRRLLFLLLWACGVQAFAWGSVLPADQPILEKFCRELLQDTCTGYVLYGQKPIELHTVRVSPYDLPGSEAHRKGVEDSLALVQLATAEGLKSSYEMVWLSDTGELLFINRPAFIAAVRSNLQLFRSQLGPQLTPESLLEEVVQSGTGLFKGHHALLGICLGYGADNAIFYDRGAKLLALLDRSDAHPPWRNPPAAQTVEQLTALLNTSGEAPSFGYASLSEEVADISSRLLPPSANYQDTGTKICFSHLSGNPESEAIITGYIQAQKLVEDALRSSDAAEVLMDRLELPRIPVHQGTDLSRTRLIAQSIRDAYQATALPLIEEETATPFWDGLRDAWQKDLSPDTSLNRHPLMRYARELASDAHAIRRQKDARDYLAAKRHHASRLADGVYSHTIRKGTGPALPPGNCAVKMRYLIRDQQGEIQCASPALMNPQEVTLSELIPGVAIGMQGMRVGELRELYLHPDRCYGLFTEFADGGAVHVSIELADIGSLKDDLTGSTWIGLEKWSDHDVDLEDYAYQCGLQVGAHYRPLADTIDLDAVADLAKQKSLLVLTGEERLQLTQVEWGIYHQ